jgi:hypothetical protein
MPDNSTVFLVSWDMTGLEACVNISDIDKQQMWATLSDQPKEGPSLNHIVGSILLRARYNAQRHYEVYTIQVSDGIDEQDLRQMFEDNPQYAADLIRERGNKLYSDRINQKTQVIQ